jgi:hypothetical protein
MPKTDSHIRKNARQYHGQTDAESLVNWLNVTEDSVGRARIIEIVSAFFKATGLEAATESKIIKGIDGFGYEEMTPKRKLVRAAKRKLDRLLSFYKVVPSILIFSSSQKGAVKLLVSWKSAPGSKVDRHSRTIPKPGPEQKWKTHYDLPGGQMGEIGALFNVLELIKSGLVSKIDVCPCGRFYFKKFAHQRFCSTKCKLAEFRTNEEERRKRNEYARNLYHLHKSGKVK